MPLSRAQIDRLAVASRTSDYTQLLLTLPSCGTCAAAPVSQRDGGLLAAVPVAPDLLAALGEAADSDYPGFLGPHVEVTVAVRSPDDYDTIHENAETEVILFDLSQAGFAHLTRMTPRRQVDCSPFETLEDGGPSPAETWPLASALVEAAQDWFEAQRDESDVLATYGHAAAEDVAAGGGRGRGRGRGGRGGRGAGGQGGGGAGGAPANVPADAGARELLDGLASAVAALGERFTVIEQRVGTPARPRVAPGGAPPLPPPARPPPPTMPKQLAGAISMAPPGLGLGGLGSLLPPPPRRLADPAPALGSIGGDTPHWAPEAELDEPGGAAAAEVSGSAREEVLLQVLRQQAALLQRLAPGSPNDDLSALLGGPSEITATAVGGARGTAALEAQRREFELRPGASVAMTRLLLARANGTSPQQRQDARAFFERHGSFAATSRNHDWGYVAFLLASVWNQLELGETEAAQALVGRGLAAVDQTARGSRASLGFLWTHLPESPWGVLDRPARAEQQPYSLLAPPALVASSVAYLKDLDAMQERLAPQRPPAGDAATGWQGAEAKAKAKGQPKGRADRKAAAKALAKGGGEP